MLRIVMDSAGDLPVEWIKEYQIDIIPINVHMDDKVFLENVDINIDQFYSWVKKTGRIPKTSQPSPHRVIELYQKIAQPGDVILSIHLTGKLSGTYESAVIAAQELTDEPYQILPFDTLSGTGIQGYMCREAREMDRLGAGIERIIKRLEQIRDHSEVIFTLDALEFAQKSGRVKKLEAILASVLNIKPIITLKEGTLAAVDKVRTRKASLAFILQEMADRMGEKVINAAIIHAHDLDTALEISERIKGILNIKELFVEELSIAIAANLGPGTIGIVAYPVDERVS
ncbi:MAG: DegV family protein [Anaerolineales bacterium]|nr:DegV family protein [Anaerolineales bacterium]